MIEFNDEVASPLTTFPILTRTQIKPAYNGEDEDYMIRGWCNFQLSAFD